MNLPPLKMVLILLGNNSVEQIHTFRIVGDCHSSSRYSFIGCSGGVGLVAFNARYVLHDIGSILFALGEGVQCRLSAEKQQGGCRNNRQDKCRRRTPPLFFAE